MANAKVYLLAVGVISIGVGAFWESNRHVFVPAGLLAIAVAFVLEKLGSKKHGMELDAMGEVREEWISIVIPSKELLVSDRWNLKGAHVVKRCPDQAEVELTFLEDSNHKVVKAVSLKASSSSGMTKSDTISVDSGWIFIGDSGLFESGVTSRDLERKIERGFDSVSDRRPLMVPIENGKGDLCGFVVGSGVGDGRYTLKQNCDGEYWGLKVEFL